MSDTNIAVPAYISHGYFLRFQMSLRQATGEPHSRSEIRVEEQAASSDIAQSRRLTGMFVGKHCLHKPGVCGATYCRHR